MMTSSIPESLNRLVLDCSVFQFFIDTGINYKVWTLNDAVEDKGMKDCPVQRHGCERAIEADKVSHEEESGSHLFVTEGFGSHLFVTEIQLSSIHPAEAQSTSWATGFCIFQCYSIIMRLSIALIAGWDCAPLRSIRKQPPRKMVGAKH